MLGKLLKYEYKSTGKKLIPIYGALILLAIINRLFGSLDHVGNTSFGFLGGSSIVKVIFLITTAFYMFVLTAVFIVTLTIIIQRFYKNILGDEGYLMNTLPVKAWQNILSKLIVAVSWIFVSFIVAFISIAIMGFSSFDVWEFFKGIGEIINELYSYFGFISIVIIIETIIAGILYTSTSILLFYASMSIGHMVNKRKVLCSFGVFLGLSYIMTNIIYVILLNNPLISLLENIMPSSNTSAVAFILLLIIAFNLLICFIYFFITNYILNKKLNLE